MVLDAAAARRHLVRDPLGRRAAQALAERAVGGGDLAVLGALVGNRVEQAAVVVPYLATAGAGLVLEVRRGAKRVALVRGRGSNTITWTTRRPRGGRYALTLVASSADGQRARAVTRVRVRP